MSSLTTSKSKKIVSQQQGVERTTKRILVAGGGAIVGVIGIGVGIFVPDFVPLIDPAAGLAATGGILTAGAASAAAAHSFHQTKNRHKRRRR